MSQEIRKWEYQSNDGEMVAITLDDVRQLISTDPSVTNKEVILFMEMCKARGINPWLKEAYLIKYKSKDRESQATIVVGKDFFTKTAEKNGESDGWEAGITLISDSGERVQVEGSDYNAKIDGQLVGGWARVYKKNRRVPYYASVSIKEYGQMKRNYTTGNMEYSGNWATKPATMIRKVALVQALREAYPADFAGLYSPEEIQVSEKPRGDLVEVSDVLEQEEAVYEVGERETQGGQESKSGVEEEVVGDYVEVRGELEDPADNSFDGGVAENTGKVAPGESDLFIMTTGKHKGMCLADIAFNHIEYAVWYRDNGSNQTIKKHFENVLNGAWLKSLKETK